MVSERKILVTTDGDPFEAFGKAVQQTTIIGKLLKFSKGDYLAGTNNDSIPIGTRLVAAMDNLLIGWVRWEGGRPVEQVMGLVCERYRPVPRSTLSHQDTSQWETDASGKPRDPWQATYYLLLKDPSGDELFTFTTASYGGRAAIGKLCVAYADVRRQYPNEYPVVQLLVDSYQHSKKEYGRIKTPKFDIVGWVPKAEFSDALHQVAAQEPPFPDNPDAYGAALDEDFIPF